MSFEDFPQGNDRRPTETFPVVQRTGIRFFRRMSRLAYGNLRQIGLRAFFIRDIMRAFADPATYVPETFRQMRNIGVDSIPLACIVAAFIGGVIALQVRYQLFQGIQLSVVALSVRQMIILELGPLLTGLVLTGRVGARMTAEIGTMRVTEQIDALETLAYDPIAFLVVPRLLAALVMLPVLTVFANFVGITAGWLTAILATDVMTVQFQEGLISASRPSRSSTVSSRRSCSVARSRSSARTRVTSPRPAPRASAGPRRRRSSSRAS